MWIAKVQSTFFTCFVKLFRYKTFCKVISIQPFYFKIRTRLVRCDIVPFIILLQFKWIIKQWEEGSEKLGKCTLSEASTALLIFNTCSLYSMCSKICIQMLEYAFKGLVKLLELVEFRGAWDESIRGGNVQTYMHVTCAWRPASESRACDKFEECLKWQSVCSWT